MTKEKKKGATGETAREQKYSGPARFKDKYEF